MRFNTQVEYIHNLIHNYKRLILINYKLSFNYRDKIDKVCIINYTIKIFNSKLIYFYNMSYYHPRQYIFDGKSILCNQYDEVNRDRYDQTFEDGVVENEDQVRSSSLTNTQNFNQNRISQQNEPQPQQQKEFTETAQKNYTLVPEELIEELKNNYYRQMGYVQNDPDKLYKYFLEFRVKEKKGLRINTRLKPLMKYSNDDVYYSIKHYYQVFLDTLKNGSTMAGSTKFIFKSMMRPQSQNSTLKKTNKQNTQKSDEVMKRLYPRQKQLDENEKNKMNCYDFGGFFIKLLDNYKYNYNELTNDENKLLSYWKGFSEEDRQQRKIQWENGEKDLETEMTLFLSDEEIANRLYSLFEKTKGFKSTDPKVITDFWETQIPNEDKYYKGLFKYSKKDLYNFLNVKNKKLQEDKKRQEQKDLEEKERKEKEEEEKRRKTKEEYEQLQKKLEQLSKPKDRWKTGRVMLQLKEQFQYDNIIQKMIKNEFEDNRLFKFPEEYAIYDDEQEKKVLFKNSLNKTILTKAKRDELEKRNLPLMVKTNDNDIHNDMVREREEKTIQEQDKKLDRFIKQNVIKYYKLMCKRLNTGKIELISRFLNRMYQEMLTKHKESTKRRFRKIGYGTLKKSHKYKKMHIYYPNSLKFYFFQLLRRLGRNPKGKFIFAHTDNLSFWGPSLSNNCKVHTNGCPMYCTHNSHNDMILQQRAKNFKEIFSPNTILEKDEKFNLWKRPELIKEKEKIFMCFDEAQHCTFEPKIEKKADDIAKINQMSQEELTEKRLNNMKWVGEMGLNFSQKFPIVYKEGICKKAKIAFGEGRFGEVRKLLEKAFDIDSIKAYFDPKFAAELKKKKMEERQKEENEKGKVDPMAAFKKEENKKKIEIIPDDFNKPKNKEICTEVYLMVKEMEDYKKRKEKAAKRLKSELAMIEYNRKIENNEIVDSKAIVPNSKMTENNPQFAYIKDRYFKFFKTLMCPLKDQCPFIQPRWPSSDINASVPYGAKCPYAHQISELKFEQEIKEKIKLRKNLLKELQKDEDPSIEYNWIPTGPILSCTGCGKTFSEQKRRQAGRGDNAVKETTKGLCGFCRYNQKNELDLNKDKIAAAKANKKILEKINYQGKPEEIDQDYMKKFGMLKKAIVLFSFRRFTDSEAIMEKLMTIVEGEQGEYQDKFKNLDKKWRAKLEIKEEIPFEVLNYNVTQEILNYFKIKTPLATFLLYCDKMKKGNKFSIYNRHTYLNRQIEEFYGTVKKTLGKYNTDVKHLRKQIERLDEWITNKHKMKNEDKKNYEKFRKKYCNKTCEIFMKNRSCSKKNCEDAHYPNQLNLIAPEKDKALMLNNMRETKGKMKSSSVLVPWTYPKQNLIEQGLEFDKKLVREFATTPNNTTVNHRSKSAKRLTQRDLSKLRIQCHEI